MTATGKRLSREQRRAQLVGLGVEMVGEASLADLSVEDVAEAAGISRSLLFHYFPTKREFLVAVVEAGADQLLAATETDPSLPPADRLRDGLERYLDYVTERRGAYMALVRGATGGDPSLQDVFDRTRRQLADRILDGLGLTWQTAPPALRLAVQGWVAFVEEATVSWLRDGGVDREALLDLAVTTLQAATRHVLGGDPLA